ILAEFKALQPDPAALAAAKQMIKERKSISTVAKETGLDEFTVGVLENEFQHSPLEGEEAEIATKMIFEGSSARDVHNATKFNQNKVSALIHALTGDVIDKVNELIRARQEDREIAKVTGLHDRTVLWLRDKYNSQPLTGADAELAKKMLNDGMGVPEIVKKAEVSISHDQLRMLFPEISGEKVEKVKEMLKAGTHEHDIHMAAGLCLEIVIYWKEELGLKKRKKLAQ
ncbi:MAG: hypothetical protein FWB74_06900, partial [Defluviitaleaceae bacterium]|nr:hypothetical protein [Defluviitaleaceae bacterium]